MRVIFPPVLFSTLSLRASGYRWCSSSNNSIVIIVKLLQVVCIFHTHHNYPILLMNERVQHSFRKLKDRKTNASIEFARWGFQLCSYVRITRNSGKPPSFHMDSIWKQGSPSIYGFMSITRLCKQNTRKKLIARKSECWAFFQIFWVNIGKRYWKHGHFVQLTVISFQMVCKIHEFFLLEKQAILNNNIHENATLISMLSKIVICLLKRGSRNVQLVRADSSRVLLGYQLNFSGKTRDGPLASCSSLSLTVGKINPLVKRFFFQRVYAYVTIQYANGSLL